MKAVLDYNFIKNILVQIHDIFNGYNPLSRIGKLMNLVYPLLFILLITTLKNKNLKIFLYFISFLAILSIQLKIPLSVIGENLFKKNMHVEKFEKTKQNIFNKDYIHAFKIILNKKSYSDNKIKFKYLSDKTFDNYYKFEDYAFIKNIVKDSRVMSVGLDPMVAVMNNIKVIDGYHNIYPLDYKIKFRKIIEKELESNIKLKKYYDNWGSRVYAFYNDQNNLMLNFQYAKRLNADYVISKFPIENDVLKIICYKCNNSSQIFLYKIL